MELKQIDKAWQHCGNSAWKELKAGQKKKIIGWFKKNLGVGSLEDDGYRTIFAYMSCPSETEIPRYKLDLVKSDERPKHIGLDLRVYPDAESKKKADDKFKELFPFHVPMFGGEAKAQEIAEMHAFNGYDGYLYRITDLDGNPVRWIDGQEEVFANSRNAIEKVSKYSTFTSPVKVTKKKALAMFVKDGEEDFTGKTAGGRIMSDKQDDEFREFLKTV